MRKIIIDCDPGHDDAIAIMMAAAHPALLEIAAITTVCGNNTLEKVTRNALVTAEIAGIRPIIARGMSRPLVGEPVISAEFHGDSGMDGPTNLTEPIIEPDSRHAVEVMRDILTRSETPVDIVALGPLTNIAVLLRLYPALIAKIGMISLMGGGLAHGNVTRDAEFNIYVDPEAAQMVFSSGLPIVMSGLDLTEQVLIMPGVYEHLREKGAVGQFFSELMDFYGGSAAKFGLVGSAMHDPCAVAWLLQPTLFTGVQGEISVALSGEERGKTLFAPSEGGNTLVLTGGDCKAAAAFILECVDKLSNTNIPRKCR